MDRTHSITNKNSHKSGIAKAPIAVKALITVIASIVVLTGAFAMASADQVMDRIVANVNGEIILLSDLRKEMANLRNIQRQGASLGESNMTESAVLQSLIDEKIIAFYAKERAMNVKNSEIDKMVEEVKQRNGFTSEVLKQALESQNTSMEKFRESLKRQSLIRKIMNFEVGPANISDEEIRAFYNRNNTKYTKGGRVKASHIVIMAPEGASDDRNREAEKTVLNILGKLRNGANFTDMASEYSQDGSAKIGGDLGWFKPGDMVAEFENMAFSLKKGEMGGPVKTRFGYHIILITDREEPIMAAYEDVAEKIRKDLSNKEFNRKRQAWIQRLREQAYVEILY